MQSKKILTGFLWVSCICTSCTHQIDVYDGFEKPGLSKLWRTDKMVEKSFEIQHEVVRSGKSAAMIILKTGDVFESGIGKSKDSERDEFCEVKKLNSLEGKMYEYRFSMFFPSDFPIVPTRLVVAQWKQKCDAESCSDDSPVLAIRYVSGRLCITMQTDSLRQTLYEIVNYLGVTSYNESNGYPAKNNRYYFKMGLYRDRMPEPMTIYIDEYRKREAKEL